MKTSINSFAASALSRRLLLLTATVLFALPPSLIANSVDTMPYWGGVEITGFDYATSVGETFRVTDMDALVTSITVPVFGDGASHGNKPTEFQIGVAAWNGNRPTGPMLYLSDKLVAPDFQWQTFTVTPNNLSLVRNQEYLLLLTSFNSWPADVPSVGGLGYVPNSPYPDGKYVRLSSVNPSVSGLFSNDWSRIGTANIAFTVTYQAQIPEPSSSGLLALGMLGMIFLLRRRV